MAKTYIDIVKYMVEARFDISGMVDKPDIIGAVFGQTEGLLGSDLDLRELQKNGKIGRIEIEASTSGNKTYGKLFLPSSLGRVETCILGAAIESVDRVGPFETTFKITKVEDTRSEKRKKIVDRAKELVKTLITTEMPDSKEISDLVEADVKSSVVTTYGPESLPAGPEIDKSEDVILVEGRADVVNLLRNDIANCVAVGGAAGTIPQTIINLAAAKEATLFVDGDRGGDIITRGIVNVAEIDFIARAPDGKEVEELTRKEIIKALRSRVPTEQIFHNLKNRGGDQKQPPKLETANEMQENRQQIERAQERQQAQAQQRPQFHPVPSPSEISTRLMSREQPRRPEINQEPQRQEQKLHDSVPKSGIADAKPPASPQIDVPSINGDEGTTTPSEQKESADQNMIAALGELHDTLRGRIYDSEGNFTEVPIRELIQTVQNFNKSIRSVVFDGIITQRLIEVAYRKNIKSIYGLRAGQVSRTYNEMLLYTTEKGEL
jgi:DNA primase